jgi:hypothetical protein
MRILNKNHSSLSYARDWLGRHLDGKTDKAPVKAAVYEIRYIRTYPVPLVTVQALRVELVRR